MTLSLWGAGEAHYITQVKQQHGAVALIHIPRPYKKWILKDMLWPWRKSSTCNEDGGWVKWRQCFKHGTEEHVGIPVASGGLWGFIWDGINLNTVHSVVFIIRVIIIGGCYAGVVSMWDFYREAFSAPVWWDKIEKRVSKRIEKLPSIINKIHCRGFILS